MIIMKSQYIFVFYRTGRCVIRCADKIIPECSTPLIPAILNIGYDGDSRQLGCPAMKSYIEVGWKIARVDQCLESRVAYGRDDELIAASRYSGEEETAIVMSSSTYGRSVQKNTDSGNGFAGRGICYRS